MIRVVLSISAKIDDDVSGYPLISMQTGLAIEGVPTEPEKLIASRVAIVMDKLVDDMRRESEVLTNQDWGEGYGQDS